LTQSYAANAAVPFFDRNHETIGITRHFKTSSGKLFDCKYLGAEAAFGSGLEIFGFVAGRACLFRGHPQ
jgi:hypothetical protein